MKHFLHALWLTALQKMSEKGVSVEKVAQLKKQVEEGTYELDPMAIARAMYNL